MRAIPLAVVTALPDSGAALFVRELAAKGLKPSLFLIDKGDIESRGSYLKARFRKIRKRGVIGPLVSRRLIASATGGPVHDGRALCNELGISVVEVPTINHPEALVALNDGDVQQALSLGNRFIRPHVLRELHPPIFNLHHGKVPEYRGGPPVFWEVHDGLAEVGYTLHRIDEGIDTGDVILSGRVPIVYGTTLSETLEATWTVLLQRSIGDVVREVETNFPLGAGATPQSSRGVLRTSPRLSDLIRASRKVRAKR